MKRPALRGLPYLFLLVFLYCTVTTPGQAQQQEGEREEQTLELSTLAVNVDSDLRFVLPAGTISEQVTRSFRHLDIEFAVSYTLLDSDTAGSILFRYPVWMLEPRIEFAYSLDFEQTVSPRLENGELELIAGDKYLSRLKEVDLGIRLTPFAGFHVTPSFRITSLFKGDLDEAVVVDRGTDYSAILSWGYDSLESREAERGLLFEGTRYLSSVKLVSRDRLDNPAHADSSNDLLLRFTAGSFWRFKQAAISVEPPSIRLAGGAEHLLFTGRAGQPAGLRRTVRAQLPLFPGEPEHGAGVPDTDGSVFSRG